MIDNNYSDSRFPEPPYEIEADKGDIDIEAIEWAYQNLSICGYDDDTEESSMMMRRIELIIENNY